MPQRPRFPIFALLVTLAVTAVCLNLAWWQYQRAGEKKAYLETIETRANAEPESLDALLEHQDPAHRPVRVSGQLDNRRSLLLDNRAYQGQAGYHLLTPLRTDAGRWVLVNRGWLPRGERRDALPEIPPVDETVTVTGTVYLPDARALVLKDIPLKENQRPLRIQKVDFEAIGHRFGVELAPFEIRVAPEQALGSSDPLPRPWRDVAARVSPERHLGYALQWLGIGFAAPVVFWFASRRNRRRKTESDV